MLVITISIQNNLLQNACGMKLPVWEGESWMSELVLPWLFSFQELTLGICPLWKMTCFVNANDSETSLRGILITYKSEAQPEYSDT